MRANRTYAPPFARSSSDQILELIRSKAYGGAGRTYVTNPYEQSGGIYRLVNIVAGALVDGDLGVYRKSKVKGVADQLQDSGDAYDLIENPMGMEDPNGDGDQVILTKGDFLFVVAALAALGRSAGVLVQPGRLTDKPVRMLPLPPGSLTALRATSEPWKILGWRASYGTETLLLRPKDALRFRYAPDPFNPLDGVGPAIPAQTSIDTREAALKYNKHALENGGTLGGILQYAEDVTLDDAEVKEIRRRFAERHFGPENAEKLAVLTGKFQWIDTGKSAKDMQYGTTLDKSLEDMARPFGSPLVFLGVADHSALSRATVLVEKSLLYHSSLLQVAKRFAEQFTRVVRRIDPNLYCWWDFSKVDALKEDEAERQARAKTYLDMGYTLAGVDKKYEFGIDLPPYADKRLVQASLIPEQMAHEGAALGLGGPEPTAQESEQPLGGATPVAEPVSAQLLSGAQMAEATNIVKSVAAGELPRDSGLGLLETMFGLTPQQAEKIMGSAGTKTPTTPNPKPTAEVTPPAALLPSPEDAERAFVDKRTRAWNAYVRKVQPYESSIAGAYRRFLNSQRAKLLKALNGESRGFTRDDASDARRIAETFDVEAFIDAISKAIENAFIAGAQQSGRELLDLGLANDALLEAEKGRLPKLAESYWNARSKTTIKTGERIREAIHDSILEGLTNGEGQNDLAERVRAIFRGELQESAVRRIARTEAHTATSNGRFELMKRQGVKKHEWLSAKDQHVRESHQNVDGEVVEVGEKFSNGLRYPGDPAGPADETVHCRCVALPVADDVERFAEATIEAAHVDFREVELCVRHTSSELAHRALELGVEPSVRVVAKAIPRILAIEARLRSVDTGAREALRSLLPSMTKNAAVSGAVRSLGGTLFASIWTEAYESDLAA